jgi:glycosyltransferase involved in cell wall biosynthesis
MSYQGETAAPTVTVVMIFLNAEAFIREAIDSVLFQTYQDFELILVDDGSTDGSTALAREYATWYPDRIRYVEHPAHANLGMSASRNLGVRVGRGRFISFLDSDDIWLATRLERFVAAIEATPEAAMVYGPTLYWYSWAAGRGLGTGIANVEDFPGQLHLQPDTLIQAPEPLRVFLESGGACLPGICSLIVRREAYAAVGGFEADFRGLYEDQVFLSKIVLTYPVFLISEVLDYYRQHTDSCCHRAIESGEYHPSALHPARERYLLWLEQYCRRNGVSDHRVLEALRRELQNYQSPAGRVTVAAVQWRTKTDRTLRARLPPTAYKGLRLLIHGLKTAFSSDR